MSRGAVLIALSLLGAAAAGADEAAIVMPTALAAGVDTGGRSAVAIGIESLPDGALVTVSEAVRALCAEPGYPLTGAERCGDLGAVDAPPDFSVPAELSALVGAVHDAVDVVERVVAFVTRRVCLDDGETGPQDSASVLRRGRGRCSGRANLAIGLLRRLGIPARAVHGLLLGDDGPRWHRWGEAWLGPLGWVPFDPGASVGIVSVRYLPLRGSEEGSPLAGVRVVRLDEQGYLGVPFRDGLRVLPLRGVTLRCVAPAGRADLTALLLGPDGSRWVRRGQGGVVFEGMLPGRYRIVWGRIGPPGILDLVLGSTPDVLIELGARGEAGS